MPKVSVLTPIYNTDPEHLRTMIESILNQTFADFEFIILNDSPENTGLDEIVADYKDSRIRYIKNEVNLGISASRNKLMTLSEGEYLAIFDHDDISMPNRLEREVEYLDEHPEVGVCSCNAREIPANKPMINPQNNSEIKRLLVDHCVMVHSGSMLRKSILIENNIRWEANYSPSEDYMLWIRLMGVTMFHNIQEELICYRNFDGNTTSRQKEKMVDKTMLIRSVAQRTYPSFFVENCRKSWVNLFGILPIVKIKKYSTVSKYYLFGCILIASIKG